MKTTNKLYINTAKGTKAAVKLSKDKYFFLDEVQYTAPFEHKGRFVSGTIKTHTLKKTVQQKPEPKKVYETDFKVPDGLTFDEFGDFSTSNNKYVHAIKTIKRPKARKARMNIKIENAVQTNAYNGAMYANAMIETISQTKKNNNKRKQNRK